jgi:hypothetical protein
VEGGGGAPVSTVILEPSDSPLGAAAVAAVDKWRFRAFLGANGKLLAKEVSSRLVFYFSVRNSGTKVLDAVLQVLEEDRVRYERRKASQ